MSVVTLVEYTPIPRFDGTAWTIAIIEEAAVSAGPWTEIDSFTLSPVDTDPSNPQSRNFTTEHGTLDQGWYRIVWADADSNQSASAPVQNIDANRANGYTPSLADVAQLIRLRTFTPDGAFLGTFTAATNPTAEQAMAVINDAAAELEGTFGKADVVPAPLLAGARNCVKYRAAAMIEMGFFSDEVQAGNSPYDRLYQLAKDALADFILRRKQLGADREPGTSDDQSGAGLPYYSFPPVVLPIVADAETPFDALGGEW